MHFLPLSYLLFVYMYIFNDEYKCKLTIIYIYFTWFNIISSLDILLLKICRNFEFEIKCAGEFERIARGF